MGKSSERMFPPIGGGFLAMALAFALTSCIFLEPPSGSDIPSVVTRKVLWASSERLYVPSDPPLIRAVRAGNLERLEKLLAAGGDIEVMDEDGVTAFTAAAEDENIQAMRMLLEAGANINAYPKWGKRAFEQRERWESLRARDEKPHTFCVDLLSWGCRRFHALCDEAVIEGDPFMRAGDCWLPEQTGYLRLGHGAHATFYPDRSVFGDNPIILAARQQNLDAMRLLLNAGAYLGAESAMGATALEYAAAGTNPEMVKLLLEAGADPNNEYRVYRESLADSYVLTSALEIATRYRLAENMRLLLKWGADPNAALRLLTNFDVTDPRRFWEQEGQVSVEQAIEILMENGADIDILDDNGWTILMREARHGNIDNIRALLSAGADLSVRAEEGYIGYMRVSGYSLREARELLPYGKGMTAEEIARTIGHTAAANFLRLAERKCESRSDDGCIQRIWDGG